jgi:hypothetical protein
MITCWQCGVEPLESIEVTRMGEREPSYVPGRWPPGDHEHAVNPPTPSELLAAGDRAVARILEEWAR